MTGNERIRVLYIMGTARSGSTILEILLAHGERCLGVGELTAIVQDGFIENKLCSCGAPFDQCTFWGKVKEKLALSQEALQEWAELQHKVDWHTGFLRQCFGLLSVHAWERYCEYNRKLLQALREISGVGIIVDSSKYAGRALALSRMNEVDLRVICLTRSPEGLMASFQKPNKEEQRSKKPWAVFCYYVFVMISLRVAMMKLGEDRIYTLRFEELLANPVGQIARLAAWASMDQGKTLWRLDKRKYFDVGHLVTGNRLRKQGRVRFNPKAHAMPSKYFLKKNVIAIMNVWRQLLEF